MLLFVLRANTDSVDVLKATSDCCGPTVTIVILVAFVTQPIVATVALHVNTAVAPSGTGDGLSVTLTSDELPPGVTTTHVDINYCKIEHVCVCYHYLCSHEPIKIAISNRHRVFIMRKATDKRADKQGVWPT